MARKSIDEVKRELDALNIKYADDMPYAKLCELLNAAVKETFDEEAIRQEAERKARIEAEAKAKVEAEMKAQNAVSGRKPSPEEIAVKTDPLIEVRFTNIESPGVALSFTYGGKRFELDDGQVVKLPVCVVNHLNNLRIPVRKYDENAPSGQQIAVTGTRNRFSCQPVNLKVG
jgi:hypothetical protein